MENGIKQKINKTEIDKIVGNPNMVRITYYTILDTKEVIHEKRMKGSK